MPHHIFTMESDSPIVFNIMASSDGSQLYSDFQAKVDQFHEVFAVDTPAIPGVPDPEVCLLRVELMTEELDELIKAIHAGDLVGVADGIADLHYVVSGTASAFGINELPIFDEVHRSNMSKVWPDETVHKREDGKVLKPPTYSPADLVPILEAQGWTGPSQLLENEPEVINAGVKS